jgi:hypothetical protein
MPKHAWATIADAGVGVTRPVPCWPVRAPYVLDCRSPAHAPEANMKRLVAPWVLALALTGLSSVAKADIITFSATLTGAGEVPPNGSPGTGLALVTLNGDLLTVFVSFSGLLSPTTASHIHCCAPLGVNASVATTLPTFPNFPLGVMSGSYLQTFDLNVAGSYNPAFVTANGGTVASAKASLVGGMLAGQSYLNIHTMANPGGEIRGQLVAAPEPSTVALLSTGLLGMATVVRKRKRRVS